MVFSDLKSPLILAYWHLNFPTLAVVGMDLGLFGFVRFLPPIVVLVV